MRVALVVGVVAWIALPIVMVALVFWNMSRTMERDQEYISNVVWSVDGQRIAYTTDEAVWLVPADGTERPWQIRVLPEDVWMVQWLSWVADGSELSYVTISYQGTAILWTVDVESGEARDVGELSALFAFSSGVTPGFSTRWSPDGVAVAVGNSGGDVYVLDAETGRVHAWMGFDPGTLEGPIWTAVGDAVITAGVRRPTGGEGIWSLSIDGDRTLLSRATDVTRLAVEPVTGGRIAFEGCAPDGPSPIICGRWFVMERDGSDLRPVAGPPSWAAKEPFKWELHPVPDGTIAARLSPDGTRVARTAGGGLGHELWVHNVDGTDPILVAVR